MYSAVRLVSAGMSFYLFALLARLYAPSVTADCYFFLFIFGFLAAALRMAANINAGVLAARTRTANLRRVQRANCIAFMGALMIAPFGALALQPHTGNPWLLGPAMMVLVFAAVDFDMPRALVDKGPQFPAAFAIGSCIAVGLLILVPDRSQGLAITAMLAQWVPASLLGIRALVRMGWRRMKDSSRGISREVRPLLWVLAVALFDGLVLNAPFFLGSAQPDDARIDVSVVIRIFSASLLFAPLILHWSNSPALSRLSHFFRMPPEKVYLVLQIALSFASAVAFMSAYTLISGQPIRAHQAIAVAVLLMAYSFYASASRHQGSLLPTTQRALLYTALLVSFFGMARWMLPVLGAVHFSMLQGGALLLGAWLLRQNKRT